VPALLACLALAAVPAGCGGPQQKPAPAGPDTAKVGEHEISQPYTHDNLTVFMIYGEDKIEADAFLTLQEAIEQGKIVVHETGNVSSLSVENGGETAIYIQSGEIVRGGRQDRVIQHDLIVPPRSGKMPIGSFCVESGRWTARAGESAGQFNSSANCAVGKSMNLAVKHAGNQNDVWQSVSEAQGKLSDNLAADVTSQLSRTSMELTLSHEKVQAAAQQYVQRFGHLIDEKKNVVGFAFAVNGKIHSIDIYASHALFRKLWPKLLKAGAVEAIAEKRKGEAFAAATVEDVKSFILDARKAKASRKDLAGGTVLYTYDSSGRILWQTDDLRSNVAVHQNYLTKE
jgi:hypothetical protein